MKPQGKQILCHLSYREVWFRRWGVCPLRRRPGVNPWVWKVPWRGKWRPTPVFLPGESHRQRSLVGYSPWGCKEPDTTERLPFKWYNLLI